MSCKNYSNAGLFLSAWRKSNIMLPHEKGSKKYLKSHPYNLLFACYRKNSTYSRWNVFLFNGKRISLTNYVLCISVSINSYFNRENIVGEKRQICFDILLIFPDEQHFSSQIIFSDRKVYPTNTYFRPTPSQHFNVRSTLFQRCLSTLK